IISTLPSITSESTYLSCYTFVDTLSAGLSYLTGDVKLELFTDSGCTDLITTWREADGMFTVRYNTASNNANAMTIEMTTRGLAELNASKVVYSGASMVNSGYSDCTVRITYQAKLDSDSSVVYGDSGNPNEVVLTWKRTSQNYYDTLVDDAHVYTYGIDVTKLFSDGKGDFSKVEFLVKNKTDNYFVKAELNQADGFYYVVGHVVNEADATHFIPVDSKGTPGKVIIKGVEDDEYIITEVRTDNGYTLLKEAITVAISQKSSSQLCDCYSRDALLTAAAAVDGNSVSMLADGNSKNAEAPLSVVNTRGFDLPKTGDNGTMFITVTGIVMMAAAAVVIILATRKKNKR
ncbi:MAG: isopeptide-forming domain-containing fimbrial protein, partial [Faecousia sp.]